MSQKASTAMTQKADTHTTSEVDSLRAEIVRLKKIIDDYVYIAKASAKEIKQLRSRRSL